MYNRDYLYFSPLNNFRGNVKNENGREDPREGDISLNNIYDITISIDEQNIGHAKSGIITKYLDDPAYKICSFYMMRYDSNFNPFPIDARITQKGDKALFIHDYVNFFHALDNSCQSLKSSRNIIQYYDPKSYRGELSLFHKDEYFAFENEFRIIIESDHINGMEIPLDTMKKHVTLLNTADLVGDKIRLEPI